MKKSIFSLCLVVAIICIATISCKKSSVPNSFNAVIGGVSYTFDSLYGSVDTRVSGLRSISISGKNTSNGNLFNMLIATNTVDNLTGTYDYINPKPNPIPSSYKWLIAIAINLNAGANTTYYSLADNKTSNLTVSILSSSDISGSFSMIVNPLATNGVPDATKPIATSGSFKIPYQVLK